MYLCLVTLQLVPGLCDHVGTDLADVILVLWEGHLWPHALDAVVRRSAFPAGAVKVILWLSNFPDLLESLGIKSFRVNLQYLL